MFGPGKIPFCSSSLFFAASVFALVCLTGLQPNAIQSSGQAEISSLLPKPAAFNTNAAQVQEQDRRRIEAAYAKLPLSFEPNRGQTDARVKFLSRAGRRTLWLTKDEAVLAIAPLRAGSGEKQEVARKQNQSAPAVLRMKFVGANADPKITGEARQAGLVNYLRSKPGESRTGIPTYARVRYSSLYPGIDLVFYGNNRQLEYDLVVSPGADPGQIKLGISGADNLRIDANGNLVLKTASGEVIQQKPKIYQRKAARLVAVAGNYVINSKNEVGFTLGSFDRSSALVIDPVLRYASYLTGGGDESENGTGIAVDSSNRVVVAGWTASMEFPAGTGIEHPGLAAFAIKFDFTGSRMVFVAFVEGAVFGENVALALDAGDNIYLAGSTNGSTFGEDTFKTTPGAFQTTFGGATDAWAAKVSSTGTKLLYATFLGGSGDERAGGIAVDSSGNAYVTGSTTSKNFPVTSGVFQGECQLKSDGNCASAFLAKLDALGSHALFSSYLGGHGMQGAFGIALNQSGNAFVVGTTDAKDFPTTAGTQQTVSAGGLDVFVTQFSSSGSHLNFSTLLGGSGADRGQAIAVDPLGNPYITGRTESTNFPVKNAFQSRCSGGGCVFVTKLNSSLRLLYSTILGGGSEDSGVSGTGIAVTSGGQAYITGNPGSNFPITQNAFQRIQLSSCGNPGGAIFITKLTASGQLSYSSYLGTSMRDTMVALDRSTNAYLTGDLSYCGMIPVTPGAFQQERGPEGDTFFAKVVSLCALSTVNRSVTICAPGSGSTVTSPVRITAGTTDVTPVKLTQIYVDGKKIFEAPLSAISVNLPIAAGTHRLTVQSYDTANVIFKKSITVTVK
jgi:beta-propeller repeat-containing protein/Big-like domain-containing protein